MSTPQGSPAAAGAGWTQELRKARLHFVTGKGGTGKTTVAASLALALAAGGRRVLLVEVEGRQGIAQLFGTEPLPYAERRVASAPGGGEVSALHVDVEAALLEYFQMFYNLGFAGRTLKRMGAIEFATTLAPGLKDVLLTGKIKECVVRKDNNGSYFFDHVVVDSPPTGRVVKFLDVTRALGDVAKSGPIKKQAEGVVQILHSSKTAIHLVTLLEEMPVRETLEALPDLQKAQLRPGALFINRVRTPRLPEDTVEPAAEGEVDAAHLLEGLKTAGLDVPEAVVKNLVAETVDHAVRVATEQSAAKWLAEAEQPCIELPELTDGVDPAALYELAELMVAKGVR